jgi:hypothetical protein
LTTVIGDLAWFAISAYALTKKPFGGDVWTGGHPAVYASTGSIAAEAAGGLS